jgi:hypothetical protein
MTKQKLSLKEIQEAHDALNLLYGYKRSDVGKFDLTTIFKKQPSAKQLKHLQTATQSNTFVQALIMVPELWAKEFETELTPEYQKFLKKIRGKQK